MKPFVNAFTFVLIGLEVNTEPSMTQPEMTLSLKELVSRYTRGGDVATFTPVFHGSGEFDDNPEFEKMDALEKLQYASDLKQAISDYQNAPPKPETKTDPPAELAKPEEAEKAETKSEQKQ